MLIIELFRGDPEGAVTFSIRGAPDPFVKASRVASAQLPGKEQTHKHRQIWGIVPGLGGWPKYVYAFWGVLPYDEEKDINKIAQEIPGTIP